MSQVPIKNTGSTDKFICGVCTPPGETRIFEAAELPRHLRPEAQAPVQAAETTPAEGLLAGAVKQILPALPGLQSAELQVLRATEAAAERPRKSLLAAIDELLLERATLAEERQFFLTRPAAEVIEDLAAVEDLTELRALQVAETGSDSPRPGVLAAIEARIAAQAGVA